ncbi:hypothetical protein JCM18901_620 [Psychrobacter sp. JCM 18901]|nr:hypothetical protein JCM18901_620 [Psychrobacter sp. JCM 18901]
MSYVLSLKTLNNLSLKKQHQRLYDAYMQFEKIAEDSNATIEEILKAGEKLEKKTQY